MSNKGENSRDNNRDWETSTYAGLMFSLRKYKDRLEEERAYQLNSKPRELDVRIIDKLSDSSDRMDNAIGYFFEKHNIIELKNPREDLNIDVVWKGISYAAQYKSSGYDDTIKKNGVNVIDIDDVTLTFIRVSRPNNLFKEIKARGYEIENKFPGVYYIRGMADIKMQIVVGSELKGDEFRAIRVQKRNASSTDIKEFTVWAESLKSPRDKELAGLIMQISFSENRDTYIELRRYMKMNMMIRELFKEEFDELERDSKKRAEQMAEEQAREMIEDGMPITKIARYTKLSEERIRQLADELEVLV